MVNDDQPAYRVGIATADITPPVGTPLTGFANRGLHTSTGIYHPLRAVALSIDDGSGPVLILSAELLGFYDQADRVRGFLSQATGLPESRIVLNGSHTHCGPAIRLRDRESHGWIDEDYLQQAVQKMVKAATTAVLHSYPATLRFGVGRCDVAMCRRAPDPDRPGQVLRTLSPNPDGRTDHEVGVLTLSSSADDALRGLAFNYGCHPTSRGGLHVGGDYVSFAYDYLDDAFPSVQPAFLQGCAGDQKPRPAEAGSPSFGQRSLAQVEEIGHELGAAVESVVNGGSLAPVTGPITVRQAVITLETEPVDEPTLRAALAPEEPDYRQRWARTLLDRLEHGLPLETRVPFELQTVTFGRSLAIITMAGEMTVEHGLRLKHDLGGHFDHVMPLGYANGMVGYVPVRRQFPEFGYEVLDANQYAGRTGRYLPDTEDQIHARVHQMLGV
jgi:hypothetical protein